MISKTIGFRGLANIFRHTHLDLEGLQCTWNWMVISDHWDLGPFTTWSGGFDRSPQARMGGGQVHECNLRVWGVDLVEAGMAGMGCVSGKSSTKTIGQVNVKKL